MQDPQPADERLTHLAALVERRTGLDMHQPYLEHRLAAAPTALPDPDRLTWLPDGAPEWQHLLDRILVSETYFFRDPKQLSLMREVGLAPESLDRLPDRSLRMWSAGCCTGEEAYSLAVLGLEALVTAGHALEADGMCDCRDGWSVDVLGTDISATFLARAEGGRYTIGPLSAFRATPPGALRFFPRDGTATRVVRPDIRRAVRFRRESLLDPRAPPPTGYDVVACRNVLVYLSDTARRHALDMLCQAVRPGGLLLLGPADPRPGAPGFTPLWSRHALIYRRGGDA